MKAILFGALVLFSPLLYAQGEPEVQVDEIIRRGDMIEHITGDIRDDEGPESLIRQVTDTLSEKELDKWNIYVVGQKGCVPCQKLYEAWKTDPVLRAYAKPDDYKTSWANFHYYRYDDELQRWRWTRNSANPSALEIKEFPTVVCQPPRNGQWNASDIVYAAVYPGDSKKFARDLNTMIKAYVAKVSDARSKVQEPAPETPPQSAAKAIYSLEGHEPGEVEPPKLGMVGQQINPVLLPNDEPEDEPAPDRHLIKRRGEEIVIVTDPEGVYGTDDLDTIRALADEMQPQHGPPLKVRSIDPDKAEKLYDVDPERVPVVLRVDGGEVVERREPKVSSDKSFLGTIMFAVGLYAFYKAFGGFASMIAFMFMLCVFTLFVVLLGPPIVLALRRAWVRMNAPIDGSAPAPAQPVAPAAPVATDKDYDAMIAAKKEQLKQQLEYEKLTAELRAAKAANA